MIYIILDLYNDIDKALIGMANNNIINSADIELSV